MSRYGKKSEVSNTCTQDIQLMCVLFPWRVEYFRITATAAVTASGALVVLAIRSAGALSVQSHVLVPTSEAVAARSGLGR